MCDRIETWAQREYQKVDETGSLKPTGSHHNMRESLSALRVLCGNMPASQLALEDFEACQQLWVAKGLTITTINDRMGRLRTGLRVALRYRLIPGEVIEEAKAVEKIKPGKTNAKPPRNRQPPTWDDITTVMANADLELATMLEIHARTGMRPNELVRMRRSWLSKRTVKAPDGHTTQVMVYEPPFHKTAHHGKTREIAIGFNGMSVLESWLDRLDRFGRKIPPRSRATHSDCIWRFTAVNSYSNAVRRLVAKVNAEAGKPLVNPSFQVGMIRSYFATEFAKRTGQLTLVQQQLGHAKITTTQIYARLDVPGSWLAMEHLD